MARFMLTGKIARGSRRQMADCSGCSGPKIDRVAVAGLDHASVYSISGGAGELWVGRQRGGLTRLVESGGSFAAKTYTPADGLAQDTVYTVLRSRDGSVWAGTLSGGVSRLRKWPFHNLH